MDNPCDKIFDHKWLDPVCVEGGCQSLLLAELQRSASAVVQLIEGFPGYGTSTNALGRLKDQPEWVEFYVMVRSLGYSEGQPRVCISEGPQSTENA